MTATSLYADDIVTWAEQQVAELRRLASLAPSNAVDWEKVIEEIECVGRSEWKAIESQLRNALAHILKAFCDPDSLSAKAWRVEVARFLVEARHDYRPSMRRLIDLDRAWPEAMRLALTELHAYNVRVPPGIPAKCPFTLDELLDEGFTLEFGAGKLHRMVDARG
jgi:hypothetical protein